MIKEIKKLVFLPFILFIIFSILFFFIFSFFLQNYLHKEIIETQNQVLNIEKGHLKKEVNGFKKTFDLIFDTSYNLTNSNLEVFLKILLEKDKINNFYISKDNSFIYGKITDKKFNYEIYKNKYIILNLNKNKYLVFLTDKNENVYIIGINKKYIDSLILDKIKKYLDEINKNNPNYIAIGKITTFNPDKNGVFGYRYYMPPELKNKENTPLFINKPDIKGNFFRKEYLNCLKKNNQNCFVKYYYKNPKNNKIEEKISYFALIKPFNFDVLKGIYASQLLKEIQINVQKKQKELKEVLFYGFLIYLLMMGIYFLILSVFALKIQSKLFKGYENLINEIEKKHYYDALTNLPNRNKLIENLDNYEGIMLIDIDDFSDINDVYGFFTGNKILKHIANELGKIYENVYRAGSDEFVIVFNRKIDKTDLCEIANKNFQYKMISLTFTISGSNEKGSLLKTAESALKIAKKNKENCVLFDKEIEEEQKNRMKTIQKLRKVLENRKIIPFYQCIKGKKEKYEALMRVEMDNKIIPPAMFMDLLKEAKLYNKFSQIMIEKVFDDIKSGKIKNVSINLSYIDIIDDDTRNFIFNLIGDCKRNYEITFEILESESIKNFEIVKDFINKVKDKGIRIAIDDFGSGYSNYIRVLELQPDFIKIDGSLVKNIKDKKYFEIIKLMVEFAKKFNIKTVAEFVENEELYDILKNLGIDYFQGYYFCKPEKLENIKK